MCQYVDKQVLKRFEISTKIPCPNFKHITYQANIFMMLSKTCKTNVKMSATMTFEIKNYITRYDLPVS